MHCAEICVWSRMDTDCNLLGIGAIRHSRTKDDGPSGPVFPGRPPLRGWRRQGRDWLVAALVVSLLGLAVGGAFGEEASSVSETSRPELRSAARIPLRNGYTPPVYTVCRLGANTDEAWERVPRVPVLTDFQGEEIPSRRTDMRFAYDDEFLYLRAACEDDELVTKPDLPRDSKFFWKQDGIEIRFLPDPERDRDIKHLVFTPLGTWTSILNEEIRRAEGRVFVEASIDGTNWRLSARVPFDLLGVDPPAVGDWLRFHAARLRVGDGWHQYASSDATDWGNSMSSRYARFVFAGTPSDAPRLDRIVFEPGLLRTGENRTEVVLLNATDEPVAGALRVAEAGRAGVPGPSRLVPTTLLPGRTSVPVAFALERPGFRTYRFWFDQPGRSDELGTVCLRAGPQRVDPAELDLRHPYLFFDEASMRGIDRKLAEPAFRHWVQALREKPSDRALAVLVELEEAERKPSTDLKLAGRIAACLGRWVVDRDPGAIRLATRFARVLERDLAFEGVMDLKEGNASTGLALAYDTFHPHLSEEDREVWRSLLGRFLGLYLETARARAWQVTATPNVNAVTNGGGGFVALALLKEDPRAAEALWFARKNLWMYLNYCYGEDGGCTEGVQYWSYGGGSFMRFVIAMECVLGTDDGFFSSPRFTRWPNNIRVSLSNDGKMHGMNDTIPVPIGAEIACYLAYRLQDPLCLWWSTKAEKVRRDMLARGLKCPYGANPLYALRFRPNVPTPAEPPPLPTALNLRGIQYAILRSGTTYDCTWVAGMKGNRPPYTHHKQQDTGALYVHLRGERLILDPGYYQGDARHHTLPLVKDGGVPEMPYWLGVRQGEIIECRSVGDVRYLACDSSRFYDASVKRVVRHLVMVGDEGLVLLDDIVIEGAKPVAAQYQCGGEPEDLADGRSLLIHGRDAKLRLDLLSRKGLSLNVRKEIELSTLKWGYSFAECRWFPVKGWYRAAERDPLVTTFVDATETDPGRPELKRRKDRLVVTLPSGRDVAFVYQGERWTVDLPLSDGE